jgi:hypothetical protein
MFKACRSVNAGVRARLSPRKTALFFHSGKLKNNIAASTV